MDQGVRRLGSLGRMGAHRAGGAASGPPCFDSIWLFDHFHTRPEPIDAITFESFTALSTLSALTSRVRPGRRLAAAAGPARAAAAGPARAAAAGPARAAAELLDMCTSPGPLADPTALPTHLRHAGDVAGMARRHDPRSADNQGGRGLGWPGGQGTPTRPSVQISSAAAPGRGAQHSCLDEYRLRTSTTG